jgi:hypothetical protein
MDVLDPLGTMDAVAPHSTSFSSNIYLLKKEVHNFAKGQLICLSQSLDISDSSKLFFSVSQALKPENSLFPYLSTCLCRLYGYAITNVDGKTCVYEKEESVAFGRVYVLEKSVEIPGTKVSEFNGAEVFAEVAAQGSQEEEPGVYELLKESFGDTLEIAYYWYLNTGKFYGNMEDQPAGSEEIKLLEAIDIPSLLAEGRTTS